MDYKDTVDDINKKVNQDLKDARSNIDVEKDIVKKNLQMQEEKMLNNVFSAPEELQAAQKDIFLKIQQIRSRGVDNERNQKIIKVSLIGIIANIALSAFKAMVGLFTHSIAIVMDAVNNIADAGASLITIIGTKLSSMGPDQKHPFGYGRIEYLSSMLISVMVLYAGLSSLSESVQAIRNPQIPSYTPVSLMIVAAGVLMKIIVGHYIKQKGKELHSDSLVDIGQDSVLDSVISTSTLVAAILYITTGISLESWLGALISLVIIKSGALMMKETFSRILGEQADVSLVRDIKETILEFSEVDSVYNLVLNNYGPDIFNGSVHVTVADTLNSAQVDELSRKIIFQVYAKHEVVLNAVGIYSLNTHDKAAIRVRDDVMRLALEEPYVTQVQGFYYSKKKKVISCDIIVSFSAEDRNKVYDRVIQKIQQLYPDHILLMALGSDFGEET